MNWFTRGFYVVDQICMPESYTIFEWQPALLYQDWCDVVELASTKNYVRQRILNSLQLDEI